MRQSKVDKLYAGLKDLAEERRGKLDERHRLFQLNREVDDLEQWIDQKQENKMQAGKSVPKN